MLFNVKSYIGIILEYLHLILAKSKGHGQAYAPFSCEYLKNDIRVNFNIEIKFELSISLFNFDIGSF